nr:uncharacterized mitochondrial protein AtMg00810-like [Tanacetum cinerariifolium]
MNYHPVLAENQTNSHAGFQDTEKAGKEGTHTYVLFPVLSDGFTNPKNNKDAHTYGSEHDDDIQKSVSPDLHFSSCGDQTREQVSSTGLDFINITNDFSTAGPSVSAAKLNLTNSTNDFEEPKRVHQALKDPSWIEAMQEELLQFKMQKVWILVDLPYGKRAIGTKWVYRNKKDERGIVVKNLGRLVAQGHTQEEGIDYEEALYSLHQAPRACQDKYVAEILRKFGLSEGKSASTPIDAEKPLLKDSDGEDVDMHTYRSMIGSLMYLTSLRPDIMFVVCTCARFQMTPKVSHLNAVQRIFRYLKGKPYLGLWYPKDSPFDLVAYSDSDYAGASLDRKSITRGCQFLGCRLISWQCKKQTVVATSSTEAKYVAAASGCAQVLWMQNQLLDY